MSVVKDEFQENLWHYSLNISNDALKGPISKFSVKFISAGLRNLSFNYTVEEMGLSSIEPTVLGGVRCLDNPGAYDLQRTFEDGYFLCLYQDADVSVDRSVELDLGYSGRFNQLLIEAGEDFSPGGSKVCQHGPISWC